MKVFLHELSKLRERIAQILEYHRIDAKRAQSTDIIAHYTNWSACDAMLRAAKPGDGLTLWGGDANCLNDPLEGRALIAFGEKHYERLAGAGQKKSLTGSNFGIPHSVPHPWLRQRDTADLPPDAWKKIVEIVNDLYSPPRPSAAGWQEPRRLSSSQVYLVSFCNDEDGLDLWRPYGGNGEGVCMVMPLASAANLVVATKWAFYKVLYDDQSLIRAWILIERPLGAVWKRLGSLPSADRPAARKMILAELSPALHLYKHDEFQAEKEIRLVHQGATANPDAKELRPVLLTPKFFLKAPKCKIVIGPKATERSRRIAVLEILLKKVFKYDTPEVEISRVPYQ